MKKIKKLLDAYRFLGFRPKVAVKGKFGDNKARVIEIIRRQKKLFAAVAVLSIKVFTIEKLELSETYPVAMRESIWRLKCVGLSV